MSQSTQGVAIFGGIAVVWALASLTVLILHIFTNNDHDESHDWRDE